MGRTNKPAQRTLQSVDKALALLWAFEGAQAELGVVELARRTGINASSVSRLLGSLVAGGLVEYNRDTGRYHLGLGLVRLASLVTGRLDLRAAARPHLDTLVARTHETANLSIFGGEQAMTVDFVPSPRTVVSVVQLGRPSLVHCTSVGKLLLAFQPAAVRERALAGPLPRFTPRTLVHPEVLRAELARIREQGYAMAEEEREPELNAIAAPVYGAQGQVVAALGLQGPAHRFDHAAMLRALPALRKEAAALSRELGSPAVSVQQADAS
ncbi:MAG TPA: IclR family transcriptional regulator [Chloroflexota bacterium]|nr:IclR family transcriptional regulator [Chloroflexota bacterium]